MLYCNLEKTVLKWLIPTKEALYSSAWNHLCHRCEMWKLPDKEPFDGAAGFLLEPLFLACRYIHQTNKGIDVPQELNAEHGNVVWTGFSWGQA